MSCSRSRRDIACCLCRKAIASSPSPTAVPCSFARQDFACSLFCRAVRALCRALSLCLCPALPSIQLAAMLTPPRIGWSCVCRPPTKRVSRPIGECLWLAWIALRQPSAISRRSDAISGSGRVARSAETARALQRRPRRLAAQCASKARRPANGSRAARPGPRVGRPAAEAVGAPGGYCRDLAVGRRLISRHFPSVIGRDLGDSDVGGGLTQPGGRSHKD
jgi:hypothetical protein